jgi:hypothetical protein
MAFTHDEWREIQNMMNNALDAQGEYFVQDVVVKSDPVRKVIWTKEFGDQAIPLFTFDYQVKTYDSEVTGVSGTSPGPYTVDKKKTPRKTTAYSKEVEVLTPRIGDVVLIARHLGARRLPKCLGVLKSKNFIQEGGE